MLVILDDIRNKFPKNRISKNENTLQNAMDVLAENGIDFDSEDEHFYSVGEKELLHRLLFYIKESQQHLR